MKLFLKNSYTVVYIVDFQTYLHYNIIEEIQMSFQQGKVLTELDVKLLAFPESSDAECAFFIAKLILIMWLSGSNKGRMSHL